MKESLMLNDKLLIRNAEAKDAAEIIQLVKQVMNETPFFHSTTDEFNFTVEQEEEYIKIATLFLVAELDGKLVGSATLDRSTFSKLKHTVTFGITILQAYSGQGIGSLMMKRIIDWVLQNKVEKIDLEVFADNAPAIALYKKFGFIEEGRKRKAIKTDMGYQDTILMSRFYAN